MRGFDEAPEDLTAWLRAGLRRVEAREWRHWRFELHEAQAWRAAGIDGALTAARWRTAAVTPGTVGAWREAGIGPGEAVQWHEFKVDLAQARRLRAEGKKPESVLARGGGPGPADEEMSAFLTRVRAGGGGHGHGMTMAGYVNARWFTDEAVSWAAAQIPEPEARLWIRLGLRPAEAFDVIAAGATAVDVIAEWWDTGIPLAEVGDWIGAGLSAAEAVAQRASGVTREQAAALRALRDAGR